MAPFRRENELIWTHPTKRKSSKERSRFGEPRCKLGSKARTNSRIQFASKETKLVPKNFDPIPPSKVGLSFW